MDGECKWNSFTHGIKTSATKKRQLTLTNNFSLKFPFSKFRRKYFKSIQRYFDYLLLISKNVEDTCKY